MKPQRIQRRRARGWRMPEHTKAVTRPGRWGNHFVVVNGDRGAAQSLHREWLLSPAGAEALAAGRRELRGWNLMCFCSLPKAGEPDLCHAATWIELANMDEKRTA